MKRFLALLLALLMPGCAAAETLGLSLALEVKEDAFTAYAKQALQTVPQMENVDLDALAAAAARTLNGVTFNVAVQDDAVSSRISLAKGELLNLTLYTMEDLVYLTSPMLSGYALWDALPAESEWPLTETDRASVCESAAAAVSAWLADRKPTVTRGNFEGAAYKGGTKCATWMVSDKDIAQLADSFATQEVRDVFLRVMLSLFSVDGNELLAQFDALNASVAERDAYLYMLRIVSNDADEFVGCSLTIMDANSQLATFSLGAENHAIKLVAGLGLDESNYWWDLRVQQSRQENITYLSGSSREWVADKSESFSYVCDEDEPLASYVLRASLTESGERLLWDGSIGLGTEAANEPICSVSGSYLRQSGTVAASVSLGGSGKAAPVRVHVNLGPTDAIPPMDGTLKLCCAASPADMALYDELTEKFTASLMARLIKLLPMDLIMNINKFTLPQQ